MKFVLEVELDGIGDAPKELGRILRYWGGSINQVELAPGASQDIYDSEYRRVGQWTIEAGEAPS